MGFLDDLVSTTKNVTATAGKKTNEAVKLSKLKIRKSQVNGEIKGKKERLGDMVYSMAKSNEKDNEAFDAAIAEIDALYEQLAEVNKQLDELTGNVACTNCGEKTKNTNSYCPKCGTKLPVVQTPTEAEVAVEEAAEDSDDENEE